MANKTDYLSHDELQHIEHVNKVLQDHLDIVNSVTKLSEEAIQKFIGNYQQHVSMLRDIANSMGKVAQDIYNSTREIKVVTSGTQEIINYCQAVVRLNEILDDKLIEKLRRISTKE